MKPVLTKADFVRRYKLGEFGNASPTWNGYEEWWEDWQYDGWENRLYHIRNRVAGGPTWYNVSGDDLAVAWNNLLSQGVPPQDLYISEMAPHGSNLLQGEVQRLASRLSSGLYLRYSKLVGLPMREALLNGEKHAYRLEAKGLLLSALDVRSYEWLEYLLDEYDGHTVEFSTFARAWGTIPGYNTVFWEVRNY